MMLAEESKIQLEDSISKHLPDLPEAWRIAAFYFSKR
jgi:CubicO group peptidase (beta-lactamase class C family)